MRPFRGDGLLPGRESHVEPGLRLRLPVSPQPRHRPADAGDVRRGTPDAHASDAPPLGAPGSRQARRMGASRIGSTAAGTLAASAEAADEEKVNPPPGALAPLRSR